MIDSHCHLTYIPLSSQLDAVLTRAKEAGVHRMISIGTTPIDARAAAELAQQHEAIFFAAGLHPHYAAQWPDGAALQAALRELAALPRFVALGEMGLDRHYPEPSMEVQRRAFGWQLELVKESESWGTSLGRSSSAGGTPSPQPSPGGRGGQRSASQSACGGRGVPAIIHNREATDETIAMIRDAGIPGQRFVFHCFTGSDAELDKILELGAMVSFTGIVTFKNSAALAASAARVPLDRIMIETDAPYLTPAPHRKIKVNEPSYLPCTARLLAQQRGMSEAEFVGITDANAQRFFGLS